MYHFAFFKNYIVILICIKTAVFKITHILGGWGGIHYLQIIWAYKIIHKHFGRSFWADFLTRLVKTLGRLENWAKRFVLII